MKQNKSYFFVIVVFFLSLGVGLTWYRHVAFDVPWVSGTKQTIWSIESKIQFQSKGEPVKVSLALPDSQHGFEVLSEYTASPGYGLAYVMDGNARRAEWSIRSALGEQVLYYRLDVLANPNYKHADGMTVPEIAQPLHASPSHLTSAQEILINAQARSADNFTLARELIREFNQQQERATFLEQAYRRNEWLVNLLNAVNIPAREVLVLPLEDGRRRQQLEAVIQVFDGNDYRLFSGRSGEKNDERDTLLWEYNSRFLLDLIGGTRSNVSFSIIEQEVPVNAVGRQTLQEQAQLLDFSIHSLPLEEQTLFKGILLIPIGVLIVCFFRVFIGIKTSGTFMPVLIAIAFIQTSLTVGLVGFVSIVGLGLMIRSYVSRLNLLLVSRISVVIISVIVMIAVITVIAYQLGLSEGLKVTFFPMIILSWTIERMSILWEEEGSSEVFSQVGGSLFVAVLTYFCMLNEWLRYMTFNFLGLQFVFMALVLMIGNYKGYRLLELRRFLPLAKNADL